MSGSRRVQPSVASQWVLTTLLSQFPPKTHALVAPRKCVSFCADLPVQRLTPSVFLEPAQTIAETALCTED
jgi:hypothetical protein